MTTENEMLHPCGCTDYNGGQCYNCLNGFHAGCDGNCDKKNPPEQPKSAEEIRPINIKIHVAENFKGLAEFIKDDEIQEFYEELIVDTVLHFLSLRESSAQQMIKELEEEVKRLNAVVEWHETSTNTARDNYQRDLENGTIPLDI